MRQSELRWIQREALRAGLVNRARLAYNELIDFEADGIDIVVEPDCTTIKLCPSRETVVRLEEEIPLAPTVTEDDCNDAIRTCPVPSVSGTYLIRGNARLVHHGMKPTVEVYISEYVLKSAARKATVEVKSVERPEPELVCV